MRDGGGGHAFHGLLAASPPVAIESFWPCWQAVSGNSRSASRTAPFSTFQPGLRNNYSGWQGITGPKGAPECGIELKLSLAGTGRLHRRDARKRQQEPARLVSKRLHRSTSATTSKSWTWTHCAPLRKPLGRPQVAWNIPASDFSPVILPSFAFRVAIAHLGDLVERLELQDTVGVDRRSEADIRVFF